ncbi:hypothetical protein [Streptomyces sp. WAC 04229]|uniref:hypothetical protein n=1 Tax=Streptomyces sp. WAC 04229 TaxID=2203206 RepID=UPI003D72B02F
MRRHVARFAENADAILPLVLGVVVSVLSVLGLVSSNLVASAILAAVGVLSFALLRDRWTDQARGMDARRTAEETGVVLDEVRTRLPVIGTLDQTMDSLRSAIEGLTTVRTLKGVDIDRAFLDARRHTDRWLFKGGTGTYTRAVTLPVCVRSARMERRALLVRLEIVDPTDSALCEQYARYRASLAAGPDGTGDTWSTDRTRKESFATVLAACWYQQHYRLLDIGVGLASTMSTFRFDLSASHIIITQDDSRFPATAIARTSPLYDAYANELRTSFTQTRHVPVADAAHFPLSDTPTRAELRDLFSHLHVTLPDEYGDEDLDQIIEKALKAKNPYVDPDTLEDGSHGM